MTWPQATQTLTLISDQDPTLKHITTLHDGYLTDLVQAIKNGTIPPREEFRKAIGLPLVALKVTEKDGIIYVTFTSNGWTGPEWEAHFDRCSIELSPNVRKILNSTQFKASKAGTSRPVAILKGGLFSDDDRITKNIRAKASELKLKKLDMETQCLIRDGLTNKAINDLGLNWVVGMHEPVEIDGDLYLLATVASDAVPRLNTYYGSPDFGWSREGGFAFGASQVLKT